MPDPERDALHGGELQKAFHLREVGAAVLEIVRLGEEFQVAQHQIGMAQHTFSPGKIADAGGVERGMYALRLKLCEKFFHKRCLQQRLAARYRHAAGIAPVSAAAQRLLNQRVCFNRVAAFCRPGIRIVAVDAAQRAALQEYDIPYTRPVYRAERLDGVRCVRSSLHNLSGGIGTDGPAAKAGSTGESLLREFSESRRNRAARCAAVIPPRGRCGK